jgi:4-amino-4-deoxy-L-arabinose transferase-like glycosyltransferase
MPFLLLVAVYFLLQILTRISLSDSLHMDEAEAVLAFHELQLGYGTQPPVYAWLQWLTFSVFGVNLYALAALKNLMLFASYVSMFYMARPMLGATGAMAVSASLLFFPEIGWESHRDRTHSVLLTTMACATLWSYFALLRQPTTVRYVLFGVLVGLGLQSKYNFAIFVAGMATASLFVAQHRQTLWNRKMWIAVAVALLCLLPHGLWLLNNLDAATTGTVQKMQEGHQSGEYLQNVMSGFNSMLVSTLAAAGLPLLLYGLICRGYYRQAAIAWRNPNAHFFLCLYLTCFVLLAAVVLSGEVSRLKVRWIVPLLFSLPLAFFIVVPALAQHTVYRRILRAAGVTTLIILVGFQLRAYVGPAFGKHSAAHYPYSQLSDELATRFPDVPVLIVGDMRDAGNMYFQRPELRPLVLDQVLTKPDPLEGQVLLAIPSGTQSGWLERFRAAYPHHSVHQQGRLNLPYRYGSKETMSFDYAHIEVRKP